LGPRHQGQSSFNASGAGHALKSPSSSSCHAEMGEAPNNPITSKPQTPEAFNIPTLIVGFPVTLSSQFHARPTF
jgi:hypothetical protein